MTISRDTRTRCEDVLRLVARRAGLVFGANRRADAEAIVGRAMARAAVTAIEDYVALLERSAADLDALIAGLTVGETYFLRETTHFDFIRGVVVPELIERRAEDGVLRVWSAGCASGEEPYSLAIVLDEAGLTGRASVLGTDISRPALARAHEGVYGAWSLRGVDRQVLGRYFRQAGDRHVLDERIKKAVSFRYLNLAEDAYPSMANGTWGVDLLLCRNVLIYFDRETVARVAERLFAALAPGGWLIAGPSDPSLSALAPFETVVTRDGVFYRRPKDHAREVVSRPLARAPNTVERPSPAPGKEPIEGSIEEPIEEPVARDTAIVDQLELARSALAAGDYARALSISLAQDSAEAALVAVRARANRDGSAAAAELAATAARRYALSPPLHFIHALLLLDLGRDDDAALALRRVLYLDPSLAIAHFVLGSVLSRRGDIAGARRAYVTAAELAEAHGADEPVPLGDGEHAGHLAHAARAQADLLREDRAS